MEQEQLFKERIRAALPDAEIYFSSPDGVHWEALVRSAHFAGRSRLEQHRLVMNALAAEFGSEQLHGLALKTEVLGG